MKLIVLPSGKKIYQFEPEEKEMRLDFMSSVADLDMTLMMEALMSAEKRVKTKRAEAWDQIGILISALDPEASHASNYIPTGQFFTDGQKNSDELEEISREYAKWREAQ